MTPVDRQAHLDNERHQVREAARRLLTVAALAVEAGISRQRLDEHHAELVSEFKTTTGRRAISPDVQVVLQQQQLADSRERVHQLEGHVTLLQNRVRTLGAVITELTLEVQASNVVALPPRRRRATSSAKVEP